MMSDSSSSSVRFCAAGCKTRLSKIKHDPHLICSECRNNACTKENPCNECQNWSDEFWDKFKKHQHKLEKDRERKALKREEKVKSRDLLEVTENVGSPSSHISNPSLHLSPGQAAPSDPPSASPPPQPPTSDSLASLPDIVSALDNKFTTQINAVLQLVTGLGNRLSTFCDKAQNSEVQCSEARSVEEVAGRPVGSPRPSSLSYSPVPGSRHTMSRKETKGVCPRLVAPSTGYEEQTHRPVVRHSKGVRDHTFSSSDDGDYFSPRSRYREVPRPLKRHADHPLPAREKRFISQEEAFVRKVRDESEEAELVLAPGASGKFLFIPSQDIREASSSRAPPPFLRSPEESFMPPINDKLAALYCLDKNVDVGTSLSTSSAKQTIPSQPTARPPHPPPAQPPHLPPAQPPHLSSAASPQAAGARSDAPQVFVANDSLAEAPPPGFRPLPNQVDFSLPVFSSVAPAVSKISQPVLAPAPQSAPQVFSASQLAPSVSTSSAPVQVTSQPINSTFLEPDSVNSQAFPTAPSSSSHVSDPVVAGILEKVQDIWEVLNKPVQSAHPPPPPQKTTPAKDSSLDEVSAEEEEEETTEDDSSPSAFRALLNFLLLEFPDYFSTPEPTLPDSSLGINVASSLKTPLPKMVLSPSALKAQQDLAVWLATKRDAGKAAFAVPPSRLTKRRYGFYNTGETPSLGVAASTQGDFSSLVDAPRRSALTSSKILFSNSDIGHAVKSSFRGLELFSYLDWIVGCLGKKISTSESLSDDEANDLLGLLSCADKAVKDGTFEMSSLSSFNVLKKRELWCSLVNKGVTQSQKSALLFADISKEALFPSSLVSDISSQLSKKSTSDLLAQAIKPRMPPRQFPQVSNPFSYNIRSFRARGRGRGSSRIFSRGQFRRGQRSVPDKKRDKK